MSDDRENVVTVGSVRRHDGGENRVTLADFRGRTFIHIEVYEQRSDGPLFRRGLTFTPRTWRELLPLLETAVSLGEARLDGGRRDEWGEATMDVKGWRRP